MYELKSLKIDVVIYYSIFCCEMTDFDKTA